ncbi:hypothetical protein PAXINDRAFT_21330 [Paxillus involutus ATCC 200175]|uniref:Uncharacterized protein n=1 Tax=Paxillus involutus ATCC 200175 TaxID=664439 RepID=A0A0C9SM19_PAXIN|nr:hypothetical protein PAXINDRAFT_21330 [Paxillus involutus ATCC 200175]
MNTLVQKHAATYMVVVSSTAHTYGLQASVRWVVPNVNAGLATTGPRTTGRPQGEEITRRQKSGGKRTPQKRHHQVSNKATTTWTCTYSLNSSPSLSLPARSRSHFGTAKAKTTRP